MRRESTCRLCGRSAALLAVRPDLELFRCPTCRFVTGRPLDESRSNEGYDDLYERREPPPPTARYSEWLDRVERKAGGPGLMLEIGAGSGGLVRAALGRGWKVHATETSRSALIRLAETGCTVIPGDIAESGLSPQTYDFIAAVEVLEHVPDPQALLRQTHHLLRPGGQLLLTTPNFDGLTRRVRGLEWRVVHPEHLGYFTARTLHLALATAGFVDAAVHTRTLDLRAWRTPASAAAPRVEANGAAELRDRVESRALLRVLRDVIQVGLKATGLGDTLSAWASRSDRANVAHT